MRSTEYVIDREVHSNSTLRVGSLAHDKFDVIAEIDLAGLSNTKQVKNAILSPAHGIKLSGLATYSIGPLTFSQEFSKSQLYNKFLIPKISDLE